MIREAEILAGGLMAIAQAIHHLADAQDDANRLEGGLYPEFPQKRGWKNRD